MIYMIVPWLHANTHVGKLIDQPVQKNIISYFIKAKKGVLQLIRKKQKFIQQIN